MATLSPKGLFHKSTPSHPHILPFQTCKYIFKVKLIDLYEKHKALQG